jgi:hypothetical protein
MKTLDTLIKQASDPHRQAIIKGYADVCGSRYLPKGAAEAVREALADRRRELEGER